VSRQEAAGAEFLPAAGVKAEFEPAAVAEGEAVAAPVVLVER
jgi:hypothetical protein